MREKQNGRIGYCLQLCFWSPSSPDKLWSRTDRRITVIMYTPSSSYYDRRDWICFCPC
jgi:hypothetical protein